MRGNERGGERERERGGEGGREREGGGRRERETERERIKTDRRRRPEIKRRIESQPDSACMRARAHVVGDDRRLCTKLLSSHVHPQTITNNNQTQDSKRSNTETSLRITRPDVTR